MPRLSLSPARRGLLSVQLLLSLLFALTLPTPGLSLLSNLSNAMGYSAITATNDLIKLSPYTYCAVYQLIASWYTGGGLSSLQASYNCTSNTAPPFSYSTFSGARYGNLATGSTANDFTFVAATGVKPDCIRYIPWTETSTYVLASVQFNPVYNTPSRVAGTPTINDYTAGKVYNCLSWFNYYVTSGTNTIVQELDMWIVNNSALWY